MKLFKSMLFVVLCALCVGAFAEQSVVLNWTVPTERENGDAMGVDEIGGYEVRYTLAGATVPKVVLIPDGSATTYRIADLPAGSHAFRIAAFDTDGLYSEFVAISYATKASPGGPGTFTVERVGNDVIAACLADPNCRVAVTGEW